MNIIGYTYDADFHCVRHTRERFRHVADLDNELLDGQVIDSEGNEVRAVFMGDEFDTAPTCPECLKDFMEGKISEMPPFEGNVIGTDDDPPHTIEHTPGPWKVQFEPASNYESIRIVSDELTEYGCIEIADVYQVQGFAPQGKKPSPGNAHRANARLIAAAPELLDALEQLSRVVTFSELAFTPENVQARAAIAKAKGGAA